MFEFVERDLTSYVQTVKFTNVLGEQLGCIFIACLCWHTFIIIIIMSMVAHWLCYTSYHTNHTKSNLYSAIMSLRYRGAIMTACNLVDSSMTRISWSAALSWTAIFLQHPGTNWHLRSGNKLLWACLNECIFYCFFFFYRHQRSVDEAEQESRQSKQTCELIQNELRILAEKLEQQSHDLANTTSKLEARVVVVVV